jgi:hypothetical protein
MSICLCNKCTSILCLKMNYKTGKTFVQTLFLYAHFVIVACYSEYVGITKLVRILTSTQH